MNIPVSLCLLALALSASLAHAAEPASTTGAAIPHVRTDGEIRVLPRTRPDRQYQLYVGLPASYGKEPDRRYPVVYFLDAYWFYGAMRAIYSGLDFDKTIPEFIFVGMGYVGENLDYDQMRNLDLTPPLRYRTMFGPATEAGQADQFLNVIETLAIPLIDKEYRTDPRHRVLVGGSLGGLFTLYALYAKPDLFQGYVSTSPAVHSIWQYEDDFTRSGRDAKARLFVSVGGLEAHTYQNEVELFHRRLTGRNYMKGGYQYRRYDDMRHDGAILVGMQEGLQFVLEPLAPQRGIAAENAPLFEKDFYAIHFNRTAVLPDESRWTTKQKRLMQRHRERLDELVDSKKIIAAVRTSDGDSHAFATIALSAPSRKEAEAIAAADPAVAAGLLAFEVLSLNDAPARQ